MFEQAPEPIPPEKYKRLEMTTRNSLQMELMKLMLGDNIHAPGAQTKWMDDYRATVSNIIDNTDHAEIRDLATRGEYEKSARLIEEMLSVAA